MLLPPTVRVKLSSENAESISLTPVVVEELPFTELLGRLLTVTGKDPERIAEVLRRGTFIQGATRLRWDRLFPEPHELEPFLRTFPDSEPARPFHPDRWISLVLIGHPSGVSISREAGTRRRWFSRKTFWSELLPIVAHPIYQEFSYSENADRYRIALSGSANDQLRQAARLLAYSTLERAVRSGSFDFADLYVRR